MDSGHLPESAEYRTLTRGLFAAGMTTFMAMYSAQAVLPQLSADLGVNVGSSTLAVSATTGLVALAIIPSSALSERFGRIEVMRISAVAAGVLGLLVPLAPSFAVLVVVRALQGIALAGVPAVAMAYLAEEVNAGSVGRAMGRYVAGTTVGGLAGRLVTSLALDVMSWRWALEVAAVISIGFTALFLRTVPASRRFSAVPVGPITVSRTVIGHLGRPALAAQFALAFLLMGGFVSVYNLLSFRLLGAPFDLPQAVVGFVFCAYLAGTVSSGWAGRLADRWGRAPVLTVSVVVSGAGLALTLTSAVAPVLIGLVLFTAGFFGAHAVASGWVGILAVTHRAEASALYLFSYYLGSAVLGSVVGVVYSGSGWTAAVAVVGGLLGLALVIALTLLVRSRGVRDTQRRPIGSAA
ncbi:MFS transporter [Nakamurella sp. A5-74]|uniref:MFS transporter n=1 Tax=Nakamurella sp. A5-74 TaxID=3158264 RepID=A0AAU8DRM3_9ACTN